MIALTLSAALVAAVPAAFAHGHAQGIRWADADMLARLEAKLARRKGDGPPD